MTPEERIASGGAVLALDTNALTGFRRLAGLCNRVNLLRFAAEPLDLRLCVPAVVHMEVLFDLRQHHGASFDDKAMLQGLLDKGLTVAPFDEKHAARAAAHLAANFPQNADWQIAKRRRCLQCLGLTRPEEEARALASKKKCGATVDWVIAAHAAHEGWILVTSDNGPEFAGLELKLSLEQLEQILADLVEKRHVGGGREGAAARSCGRLGPLASSRRSWWPDPPAAGRRRRSRRSPAFATLELPAAPAGPSISTLATPRRPGRSLTASVATPRWPNEAALHRLKCPTRPPSRRCNA